MTPAPARNADRPTPSQRTATGLRLLLLTGVLVGAAGTAGHYLAWPLLTSTLGPTAYMFAAHPDDEASRARNALVGHSVAIGAGLGALALFGMAHHSSVSATGGPDWAHVGAATLAAGVTVMLLELVGSHHAPAAATALLIATGLARPGAPLEGLIFGLAIVITLGPALSRLVTLVVTGSAPGVERTVSAGRS